MKWFRDHVWKTPKWSSQMQAVLVVAKHLLEWKDVEICA